MKTIELLCGGELKFKSLQELEKKYLQNINYFVKFSIKKIKEPRHPEEAFVREKEAAMFLAEIEKKDYVIAMDKDGKKMDSLQFAGFLEQKISYHPGRLVFVIGGFAGLGVRLRQRCDHAISFSDLTFSHDLFRIVFLEQVYRALTIIHGIKYHR
ncbi:MAG: 23S rRNA (pseudouridine(1915)-N(3))-methyltransferase RlmH [Candidatus Aminicenantes bacterium]|nr:23S rRNA (pseudouridine(1915)-N(3))-methyltransferase RlmH [Candidatus Aminicenantes bacterium]